MNDDPIFQANRNSTQRMRRIIFGLSPKELSQTTPNHWPIAVTLAHLAFWDQRVIHVIELAKKNKALNAPRFDDQLNDILAPILAAIPALEAARLAINTAETLDKILEDCPAGFIEKMRKENNRLVERSLHRNDHLNEIESLLTNLKNQ